MAALNLVDGDDEPEGVLSNTLVIQQTQDIEVVSWKDRALCHGLHEIFDLDNERKQSGVERKRKRKDNKARAEVAKVICQSCPVFEKCWKDAWESDSVGVVQAATLLDSDIRATREKRLLKSMQQYRSDKNDGQRRVKPRVNSKRASSENFGRTGTSARLQSV